MKKEKKRIYISVPLTGEDRDKQREHADELARSLSRQGWKVVNPFNIYAGKTPTYEDHLVYCLRALMDCDAVYFCKGWDSSFWCGMEHEYVKGCSPSLRKRYEIIYE